jgi:hypothetical protein
VLLDEKSDSLDPARRRDRLFLEFLHPSENARERIGQSDRNLLVVRQLLTEGDVRLVDSFETVLQSLSGKEGGGRRARVAVEGRKGEL